MAFYDAMGKLLGVPAYRLMGGKYRDKVALSWVVGMQDLDASLEEAKEKLKLGYRVLKIKVGRSPETDVSLVKRIREEVGDDIPLRLDANQGYDAVTALQVFGRLEEFGLESIEQPVRRWDIRGMKMLRERLRTPVMADESVSDFHAVGQILRESACDYVNIKVGKVGGLTMAKKIAAALEAETLLLLTDVRGLLRDPKDESTLIPELQLSSVPALEREGIISGGMIPKVDCCVESVRSGVKSAVILDGRVEHSILIELLSDAGIGTMLIN